MQGLASFLAGLPFAALVIGPGERIEGVNTAAREMLGHAIAGRHFLTALRQPDMLEAIEATMRDRTPRKTTYQTSESGRDCTYRCMWHPSRPARRRACWSVSRT